MYTRYVFGVCVSTDEMNLCTSLNEIWCLMVDVEAQVKGRWCSKLIHHVLSKALLAKNANRTKTCKRRKEELTEKHQDNRGNIPGNDVETQMQWC